ncbi:TerB N-terminal domain-containing protein [Rhizobium sullae]|uniref:Putative peptidoglycan binding protein n=1 Tax=Rhizobium sullae TaxID=50338 RepID=A0A4R3PYW2_RHISU|nr:TerB N-terminal domain-containing protein [Rhizobium sullae]TCU13741.1 putative peptidoglycan binding protein [Rhizobium sullae]
MNFRFSIVIATLVTISISQTIASAEDIGRSHRDIQQALSDSGFPPGTIDGVWGRKSINALKAFQKSRGLAATGVVDEMVIKELFPLDSVIEQLKARTPPINQDAEVLSKTPPTASDIPGKLDLSPVDKQPNPVAVEKSNRVESPERLPRVAAEQVLTVPGTSADAAQVQNTEPDNHPERSNLGYALAASMMFCLIAFVAVRRRRNKERARPIDVAGKPAQLSSISSRAPAVAVSASSISPDAFSRVAPSITDTTSISPSAPMRPKVGMNGVLANGQVPFGTWRTKPIEEQATPSVPSQTSNPTAAITSGWLPAGISTTVGSISINGGLIYVGGFLPKAGARHENENCLINPKLSVARSGDPAGVTMGYWPSYSHITAEARRSYLEWLAGSRSDPNTYVGYIFLYFYGLERRLMLEKDAFDAAIVVDEVKRLMSVYGHHNSFRRYANELLSAYEVATHSPDGDWIPEVTESGYEVPTAIKMALGTRVRDGKPIEPELLLKYVLTHPETSVRTPARRAPELLKELFAEEIDRLHPNGVRIAAGRFKAIATSYRACSGSFTVEVKALGGALPDITGRAEPITTARRVFDICSDHLDGYSRALGRSGGATPSLAAIAKLPERQRYAVASSLEGQPLSKLEGIVGTARLVSVRDLVGLLGLDGEGPTGKARLREVSQLLSAFGFGHTADPSYSLSSHKPDDGVAVFSLGASPEPDSERTPSDAFRAVQLSVMLGMIIGHADGRFDDAERSSLMARIGSASELTPDERSRLKAEIKVYENDPQRLEEWTKRLKDVSGDARDELANVLIEIATADGSLHAAEVKKLEVLFKRMNVDEQSLYRRLHDRRSSRDADDDIPEFVIGPEVGPTAIPIPPPSSGKSATRIDVSRLNSIRNETRLTASVLTDIFADEEDVPAIELPVASAVVDDDELFDGLERRYGVLVSELRVSESWTAADFDHLVREAGLMPGAALEVINNWALDQFDELLIEGDDPMYVNIHLLPSGLGSTLTAAVVVTENAEGMPA